MLFEILLCCQYLILIQQEIEHLLVELGQSFEVFGVFDLQIHSLVDQPTRFHRLLSGSLLFGELGFEELRVVGDLELYGFHLGGVLGVDFLDGLFFELAQFGLAQAVLQVEALGAWVNGWSYGDCR